MKLSIFLLAAQLISGVASNRIAVNHGGRALASIDCWNRSARPIELRFDYADGAPYWRFPVPPNTRIKYPAYPSNDLFVFVLDGYKLDGIHTDGGTLHCHLIWR